MGKRHVVGRTLARGLSVQVPESGKILEQSQMAALLCTSSTKHTLYNADMLLIAWCTRPSLPPHLPTRNTTTRTPNSTKNSACFRKNFALNTVAGLSTSAWHSLWCAHEKNALGEH